MVKAQDADTLVHILRKAECTPQEILELFLGLCGGNEETLKGFMFKALKVNNSSSEKFSVLQ